MSKELQDALAALKGAVKDEGPKTGHHRMVRARVERDWPTLMKAVKQVLASPEVRKL